MKSVMILEDVEQTRAWLTDLVVEVFPGADVTAIGSIEEARQCVAEAKFDLAVVDLSLPDGSGVDIIRLLNERQPECISVVATIFDDDAHIFPALQAGAGGYLLKEQDKTQMIALLQGIIAGSPPLSPAIARRLMEYFQPSKKLEDLELTGREQDVLVLIAKGMKLSEVAKALGITQNTVAGYVKSVYRKLNVSSRAEATLAAARYGLVRPE